MRASAKKTVRRKGTRLTEDKDNENVIANLEEQKKAKSNTTAKDKICSINDQEEEVVDKLNRAIRCLQDISSPARKIRCREDEISAIRSFLEKGIRGRAEPGGVLFLGGLPGTGKTSCVSHVLLTTQMRFQRNENRPRRATRRQTLSSPPHGQSAVRVEKINAFNENVSDVIKKMTLLLGGTIAQTQELRKAWITHGVQYVEEQLLRIRAKDKGNVFCVLVVDEVDLLRRKTDPTSKRVVLSKRQQILPPSVVTSTTKTTTKAPHPSGSRGSALRASTGRTTSTEQLSFVFSPSSSSSSLGEQSPAPAAARVDLSSSSSSAFDLCFRLALNKSARLSFIAMANSIDFMEMRKEDLHVHTLLFRPYTPEQLKEILSSRLDELSLDLTSLVDDTAVELLIRKVAADSGGDCRMAMDFLRRLLAERLQAAYRIPSVSPSKLSSPCMDLTTTPMRPNRRRLVTTEKTETQSPLLVPAWKRRKSGEVSVEEFPSESTIATLEDCDRELVFQGIQKNVEFRELYSMLCAKIGTGDLKAKSQRLSDLPTQQQLLLLSICLAYKSQPKNGKNEECEDSIEKDSDALFGPVAVNSVMDQYLIFCYKMKIPTLYEKKNTKEALTAFDYLQTMGFIRMFQRGFSCTDSKIRGGKFSSPSPFKKSTKRPVALKPSPLPKSVNEKSKRCSSLEGMSVELVMSTRDILQILGSLSGIFAGCVGN